MSDHNDSEDESPMTHDESNWLVSYADMMTLLFGFFVLMYSLSRLDPSKYVVISKDIAKYFGGQVKFGSQAGQKVEIEKLNEVLLSMGLVAGQSKDFQIQAGDENSILLKLKDAVLFAPGSDQLSEVSQEMLEKVGQVLDDPLIGVDFIMDDVSVSWRDQPRSGVIECNSAPFIDLHHFPLVGKPHNVAAALWDVVYPESKIRS